MWKRRLSVELETQHGILLTGGNRFLQLSLSGLAYSKGKKSVPPEGDSSTPCYASEVVNVYEGTSFGQGKDE